MRKILISAVFVAAAIYQAPAAFSQDTGASTNPAVELAFWNSVKDSRDPSELQAYLNKYPKGQFVELAVLRKQSLEKLKISHPAPAEDLRNRSSKSDNSETKFSATDIDPRFDQYLVELKEVLNEKRRPDIRTVFPVLLPVGAVNSRKVEAMASQLFQAPFPSAGAISIGSTGMVVLGGSQFSYNVTPETQALSDCENKRKGAEALLPKCEIFFRSRTIDSRVLVSMLEKVRGPSFDAWVKGLNESISAAQRRSPAIAK
ncbi:MAG: hypothetical protein ACXWIN_03575 [Burkholderiaceae bacterium]